MSSGEVLVTAFVAVVVFGPTKLPMLATHLGQIIRKLTLLKNYMDQFWQQQLNELQLQENQRKAKEADEHYKKLKTDE